MKRSLLILTVLGTLAFTYSSASASHSTSDSDYATPQLELRPAAGDVLLADHYYRGHRYHHHYGPSYYGPGYYRGFRPYGYGGPVYRGYGGFGRYSSRYGYGPRAGFGLYIGF